MKSGIFLSSFVILATFRHFLPSFGNFCKNYISRDIQANQTLHFLILNIICPKSGTKGQNLSKLEPKWQKICQNPKFFKLSIFLDLNNTYMKTPLFQTKFGFLKTFIKYIESKTSILNSLYIVTFYVYPGWS